MEDGAMCTFDWIKGEIEHNLKRDVTNLSPASRFKEDLKFEYFDMAMLIDCLQHSYLMNYMELEISHLEVTKIFTVQDLITLADNKTKPLL